jgi:hypothetical protein
MDDGVDAVEHRRIELAVVRVPPFVARLLR